VAHAAVVVEAAVEAAAAVALTEVVAAASRTRFRVAGWGRRA